MRAPPVRPPRRCARAAPSLSGASGVLLNRHPSDWRSTQLPQLLSRCPEQRTWRPLPAARSCCAHAGLALPAAQESAGSISGSRSSCRAAQSDSKTSRLGLAAGAGCAAELPVSHSQQIAAIRAARPCSCPTPEKKRCVGQAVAVAVAAPPPPPPPPSAPVPDRTSSPSALPSSQPDFLWLLLLRPPSQLATQVRQAAAAIAAQLTTAAGSGKGKAKGFVGGSDRKLSVDVPVLETGAAATLQLAQEILAALPKQLRQQFTIVTCEEGGGSPAAAGGTCSSSGGVATVSLQQCVAEGRDLGGCLLIAGPSPTQASSGMQFNCPPSARSLPPTAHLLAALLRLGAGWATLPELPPSPPSPPLSPYGCPSVVVSAAAAGCGHEAAGLLEGPGSRGAQRGVER